MTDQRQKKMLEGKRKAEAKRRREGVQAAVKWCDWCREDAKLWSRYQNEEITREEWVAATTPGPPAPADIYFRIARDEGLIS